MLDCYVCTRVKSESLFDCVDPLEHNAATDSKANSDITHSCDVCDMFQSRSLPQKNCFTAGYHRDAYGCGGGSSPLGLLERDIMI